MIIFGLGNPGTRYHSTRHNAGYLFVDRLVHRQHRRFRSLQGYKTAHIHIQGIEAMVIKPQCWMNESGKAVRRMYGDNEEIIVVVDDINLPLGRVRLRNRGSDGGHRGLRSIIEALGHGDFVRLRIGVGRSSQDVVSHVLGPFTPRERILLNKVLDETVKGVEILLSQGFQRGQNYLNGIDFSDEIQQQIF